MQSGEQPFLQFGSVGAERVARALYVVVWGGTLALLGYLWWAGRGHFGYVLLAGWLASGSCPTALSAKPSRLFFSTTWLAVLLGPVVFVVSLIWPSRAAWMGFAFCCNGLGDWLDVKGRQRGVRSNWRLVSGALGIASMGVWLWLELQRPG